MWLVRGADFLEGDFVQCASERAWRVCGGGIQQVGDGQQDSPHQNLPFLPVEQRGSSETAKDGSQEEHLKEFEKGLGKKGENRPRQSPTSALDAQVKLNKLYIKKSSR